MKKHPNSDRMSVAWFNLAQLIARGEKEKALNLYRLLAHSFSQPGYALQVEGDILWGFGDEQAFYRYQQAAHAYQQAGNMAAVIGVYQHVISLQPRNLHMRALLIEACLESGDARQARKHLNQLFLWHSHYGLRTEQLAQVLYHVIQFCDEKRAHNVALAINHEQLGHMIGQKAPACYQLLRPYLQPHDHATVAQRTQ